MFYTFDPVRALRDIDLVSQWIDEMDTERTRPGAKLLYGNQVIWENPPDLGHFGIKLRKQILEDEICARLDRRAEARLVLESGGTMDSSL